MDHAGLIDMCARWALAKRYSVVALAECSVGCTREEPDVLGFKANGQSTLFEIKVSRSDFKADAKKPFRKKEESGLGLYRYYVTPYAMVKPEEVPEGWGLLWFRESDGKCFLKASSKRFLKRNHAAEVAMLVSAVRRIGGRTKMAPDGVSCRSYKVATESRTQLFLEGEQTPEKKD